MALLDYAAGPGRWRLDLLDSIKAPVGVFQRYYLLEKDRKYWARRTMRRTEPVRRARALDRLRTKQFVSSLTKPMRRLYEKQQVLLQEIEKLAGPELISKLTAHDINVLLTARNQLAVLEVAEEKKSRGAAQCFDTDESIDSDTKPAGSKPASQNVVPRRDGGTTRTRSPTPTRSLSRLASATGTATATGSGRLPADGPSGVPASGPLTVTQSEPVRGIRGVRGASAGSSAQTTYQCSEQAEVMHGFGRLAHGFRS
jgi:hypothetical protein